MSSRDQAANKLAEFHYRCEPAITDIFRVVAVDAEERLPNEPIKLLEVNRDTIPSGVMPLQFPPLPEQGVDWPWLLIEVTPAEYEQIQRRELALPAGWEVGAAIPRPPGD